MKFGFFYFGTLKALITAGSLRISVWIILRLIVWVSYRENEAPDTPDAKPGNSHDHKLLLKLVLHILKNPSWSSMDPQGIPKGLYAILTGHIFLIRAGRFVFVVRVGPILARPTHSSHRFSVSLWTKYVAEIHLMGKLGAELELPPPLPPNWSYPLIQLTFSLLSWDMGSQRSIVRKHAGRQASARLQVPARPPLWPPARQLTRPFRESFCWAINAGLVLLINQEYITFISLWY